MVRRVIEKPDFSEFFTTFSIKTKSMANEEKFRVFIMQFEKKNKPTKNTVTCLARSVPV